MGPGKRVRHADPLRLSALELLLLTFSTWSLAAFAVLSTLVAEAPGDLRMTTTVPTHGYYLKPCGY
jgi:hypothetical protein